MGGKHSRQQREQKQQTSRKQRKEKKSSKRSTAKEASRSNSSSSRRSSSVGGLPVSIATPEQQQTDRTEVVTTEQLRTAVIVALEEDYNNGNAASNDSSARWTLADVAASDSPVNVTESDGQYRVGVEAHGDHNEHDPEVSGGGDEDTENVGGGSSVTTITICMLKMEPNATNENTPPESCPTNDDASAATGGDATDDGGEPAEDATVTPIASVSAPAIDAELLSMAPAQCGCFENGNCSSGGFMPSAAIGSGPVTMTASTNATITHPTVTSGPIPTITSSCNCNATPLLLGASSAATIDNRLNNNNELHSQQTPLLLGDGGGTVVLTMPGGPTPTTTSSFAAASACASVAPATTAAAMWPPVSSNAMSPARSQSFGNFMLRGGADSASLVQHLMDRVRHHQHRHHHHHHHNHLMHFLHHHHHGPVPDATQSDPGSNASDWRLHVLRQYRTPTIPTVASEPVYGIPTSPVGRGSGGVTMAPPLLSPAPFLDIDMKDKLEGLDLGRLAQRATNNNLNPPPPPMLPTGDTAGEHPRSVGECPTCCAMALAAKAPGTSLGLLAGAGVSAGGPTAVFNGNVGEVEEKILNTANQQQTQPTRTSTVGSASASSDVAGGAEKRIVTAPTVLSDQISTDAATSFGKAVPSSVASSATAGSSTPVDAGKDDATPRTVAAATATPGAGTSADCDQIVVDGNSSKLTTTATLSAVSMGSVAPIGDSTLTTTGAAGRTPTVSPTPAPSASISSPSTAQKTAATPSSFSSSSSSSSSPSSTGQCCRKQSTPSGSSSAAATLLHSLSLTGRRSRNSSTTPPCNCSYCAGGDGAVVEPPQSRSFTNWISGGQKADRSGSASGGANSKQQSAPAVSGSSPASGSAKSKKPNWRVSLNCTIRRAAGGSSSSSGHTKPSSQSRLASSSEQASGKLTAASGSNVLLSAASADIGHNSIGSAGSSTALRGSSLISSSVSAKLLKGESDKDDTCVCTAYRKMSESPPPPPQSQRASGSVSPARPLSPAAASSPLAVSDDPTFIPLNMLSLVANTDGTPTPPPRGLSVPVTNDTFSSLLHNHHHHHHHHHHALAAAALAADHHQSFFFPASTASPAGAAAVHHHAPPNGVAAGGASSLFGNLSLGPGHSSANGVILLSDPNGVFDLSSDDFSLEDCDERARIQRELEIREGVDAPPNFHPRRLMSGGTISSGPAANHPIAFFYSRDLMQRGLLMANHRFLQPGDAVAGGCAAGAAAMAAAAAVAAAAASRGGAAGAAFGGLRIHSQVDFIHCLVPDLQKITSCSFYWGKMDRYEAERLLEGKPEGTFLLRDSAQEEFLFSVSFRKYNRSLHARIEQFNHKFSFDSRDPGVYTASTVTGLLEHYKDPSCVMFFEPMLTYPLNRNFSFSLQQLCRAAIVSNTTYDGINELALPKSLKAYLKEYHYRQRVRFRPLDEHLYSNA